MAADRIFGLLPEDQQDEFLALWREFEARETPEAKFANAVDRLRPSLQNLANEGGSWRDFSVTRARADARLRPIGDASAVLWEAVSRALDEGEARGCSGRALAA